MALSLIGAGFGRTGTHSMMLALEELGLGPCHHMKVLMDAPGQSAAWRAVAAGGTPDWDRLFHGFGAAVDWPSAHYWRELAAQYPQARVLLTLRDPESWWKSYSRTILASLLSDAGSGKWGSVVIAGRIMSGRPGDRDTAIAAFNANTRAVREGVPADRLILHEVGDGWGPLCAGLGLPIPDAPYPQTNSTQEFNDLLAARRAPP